MNTDNYKYTKADINRVQIDMIDAVINELTWQRLLVRDSPAVIEIANQFKKIVRKRKQHDYRSK